MTLYRFLAYIMTGMLVVAISIPSVTVHASENGEMIRITDSEDECIDSGSCGEKATWKLYEEGDGYKLVISGEGAVTTEGGHGWYFDGVYGWTSKVGSIKTLVVEEGITSIEGICKNAIALTSVSLPDGLLEIAAYSFYGCSALTEIHIPDSVEQLGYVAFFGCEGLTEIELPQNLKQMDGQVFSACRYLRMPVLPEGLETIEYNAFSMGEWLPDSEARTVNIPASVKKIGDGAFSYSAISGFTVDSQNEFFSAENGCLYSKDKSIFVQIPRVHEYDKLVLNSNTREVVSLSGSRIDLLVFPEGYTNLETGTFDQPIPSYIPNCYIKAVYLPESIEVIEESNFGQYARGLTDIYYAGTEEQWEAIDNRDPYADDKDIYFNCNLSELPPNREPDNTNGSTEGKHYSGTCGENATWELTGTGTGYKLTISGEGAVLTEGSHGMTFNGSYGWFNRMGKIETLVVEEGITSIEGICKNATSLTNVSLPEGLLEVGAYSFYNCKALTTINFPDSVEKIGYFAFIYCDGIKEIRLPENLKVVEGQAFSSCGYLKVPVLPDGLETIMYNAFSMGDCLPDSEAITVNIPASVKEIGQGAFCMSNISAFTVDSESEFFSAEDGCLYSKDKSELLQIPKVHEYEKLILSSNTRKIAREAMDTCKIKLLVFPEGFENLEENSLDKCIWGGNFYTNMVYLPASIKVIEQDVFWQYARGLTDIYYAGTKEQWDAIDLRDPYTTTKNIHYEAVLDDLISEDDARNGLGRDIDGNWYLYKNGNIDYSYTGLYGDEIYGWWLVEDGVVNFGYNDLYCDANVGWWKISGGAVDFAYTDLYESPRYGWWKVNGGSVDFGYSDLYESPSCGWWKISGGAVDFGYTDLYGSPGYGWWKVNGGAVDFGYTDLYGSPAFGWWKIIGGAVDFGYTDLYGSPVYGWWKVTGGAVDFGYTDLYGSPAYGWWIVSGGAVDFGYNDIFKSPVYGNWKVAGGAVDFGYNGQYNSQRFGHCYVTGGAATF